MYFTSNCQGNQQTQPLVYQFGECARTSSGSLKIAPLRRMGDDYDLTAEEYEERFRQRWELGSRFNKLGYGPENKFVPPLFKPRWLLSEIDRFTLVFWSWPLAPFFTREFLTSLGNFGDFTGYWYNDAEAAGS